MFLRWRRSLPTENARSPAPVRMTTRTAGRPLGHGEGPGAVVRTDERVLLQRGADEDAVVQPLGLDELELAPEVRAGEHEDDAAVCAVVLEHSLGQHRPVAGAAPDHAVQ